MRVPVEVGGRGRSSRDAVAEVHDTVAESAIVQQLEVGAGVAGQRGLASADEDGTDEQMALIDQPGLESVRREVRPPHGEMTGGRGVHVAYRGGVEVAFEPVLGG